MNLEKRQARARRNAKANRLERWQRGKARGINHSPKGGRIVSRGAGSINAEADMQQLIQADRPDEAAALFDLHHRIQGATPMRWGRAWYELYRAGDQRARGVAA